MATIGEIVTDSESEVEFTDDESLDETYQVTPLEEREAQREEKQDVQRNKSSKVL